MPPVLDVLDEDVEVPPVLDEDDVPPELEDDDVELPPVLDELDDVELPAPPSSRAPPLELEAPSPPSNGSLSEPSGAPPWSPPVLLSSVP